VVVAHLANFQAGEAVEGVEALGLVEIVEGDSLHVKAVEGARVSLRWQVLLGIVDVRERLAPAREVHTCTKLALRHVLSPSSCTGAPSSLRVSRASGGSCSVVCIVHLLTLTSSN
jgi:hypothetical protein